MIYQAPIYRETDVLVLGGTTGAVEAALAAKEGGADVFCATPFSYFGEDICHHLRLWEDFTGTRLDTRVQLPTPMHIKHTLERALIDAGIDFLLTTHVAWLLRDDTGQLAGTILANRSGFQAVRAKVVIDATGRALAARMSGAQFRPFTPGDYDFTRIVAGAAPADTTDLTITPLPSPVDVNEKLLDAFQCTQSIHMDAATPDQMSRAETAIRLATWHPEQLLTAGSAWVLTPDLLVSASPDDQIGAMKCPDDPIFVLSPQADFCDGTIDQLVDPANLMAAGARLGVHCSELARSIEQSENTTVVYGGAHQTDTNIRRADEYFRLADCAGVPVDLNRVPTLSSVDVLVAGGGTAGAPAGIAAGRAGANTLVLEQVAGLGGVGTEGRIASYYHGNICGFTSEIDRGLSELGDDKRFSPTALKWNTEWKRYWYLREAHAASVDIWFGSITIAAACSGQTVRGVVAATPWGVGMIDAACVVDCSGNADVAAAAGATTVNIGAANIAVQGTGLSPFIPGHHYFNTDYTFIDDTDILDVTRGFALSREKFQGLFDVAQNVNSRQRRQILGDLKLDAVDFLAKRTYPDTITTAQSNFDSHGYTIHPVFMTLPPDKQSHRAHIPFRSLLPIGWDGIMATGLGLSCHRDALPVVRMQPDVQNQGYAAGRAAAMSAQESIPLREIDIRELQRHLIEVGILEPDVVEHTDSFPLADDAIDEAIATGTEGHTGLAIIFAEPDRSLPRLLDAYGSAQGERQVRLAKIMGLMGDATGADALVDQLNSNDWDEGWNYRGMGQFGFSMSEIDSMLVALARSGDARAVSAVLAKLKTVRPDSEFSHFRALTIALETQPTPDATQRLGELLSQPPIAGNSRDRISQVVDCPPESTTETGERSRELSEIHLARALLACGDPAGKAREVLKRYANDVHGHYARHARALLSRSTCRGSTQVQRS